MSPLTRSLLLLVSVSLLASCGQSLSSQFDLAAKKQAALEGRTMDLWKRGPATDAGTQVLTSQDNLDVVPRVSVVLPDIVDVNAPIRSSNVIMYESTANEKAPTFFDWAGKRVPTATSDFQIFHTYYHLSVAMAYAKKIYPDFKPEFSPMLDSSDGTYRIYAAEPGDFSLTGYNYLSKNIKFYKQNTGVAIGFNPASEADSIYHEFGHSVMHAISAPLVTAPSGKADDKSFVYYDPDLDAIQEGLADFFAAAVTRDDHILQYLSAHAKFFADPQARMGSEIFREADNDLYFPDGFRNEIHMDGRLISETLADIRKWLSHETVLTLKGCDPKTDSNNCIITPSTVNAMPKEDAYDAVAQYAFALFASLEVDSTFQDWAEILRDACSSSDATSFDICDSTKHPGLPTAIASILHSRGLLSDDADLSSTLQTSSGASANGLNANGMQMGGDAAYNPVYVDANIGWIPFPSSDLANTNSTVEPCELILIFPNIVNHTDTITLAGQSGPTPSAIYDIRVELAGTTGFRSYVNPKNNKATDDIRYGIPTSNTGTYPSRYLGWLDPGEDTQSKLGASDSGWYKLLGHSVFTQHLSRTHFPTGVGFLVQAPSDNSVVPKAYFRVSYRMYSSQSVNDLTSATTVSPWIKVNNVPLQLPLATSNSKTFCTNATTTTPSN